MVSLITKDNKLKIDGILYNREPIKVVNNILFVKFIKTEDEDEEAFENRIQLYKSKVGEHNKNMHHSNYYFDSGFDIFQPKNNTGALKNKTYKVDLGIQTAMFNCDTVILSHKKAENMTPEKWQEFIKFDANTVKNFTTYCEAGYAKAEPYVIHPRSSIYKKSFRLANSTGIIDTGYRGNLGAVIDNDSFLGKETSTKNVLVEGERYFQICRADLQRFYVQIVQDLPETSRGEGGFGSTGN